jgi:DNA-binding XRE family transcriptional regulator
MELSQQRLVIARESLGLTQRLFGKLIGKSFWTICQWEKNGTKLPSEISLQLRKLGINDEYINFGTDDIILPKTRLIDVRNAINNELNEIDMLNDKVRKEEL